MIHLVNLEKSFNSTFGKHTVLHKTNLSIPSSMRVGVLGVNGSGKSTLLKMIAGSEPPTSGSIHRECRCSWPLGFAGSFQPNLTGLENIMFAARIYGADRGDVVDFAAEFAELGNYIDMPVRTYSSGMKARLAFGLSLAIDFDIYLIDEITTVGDKRFQDKCKQEFKNRISKSGIIFVSHNEHNIRNYCESALVLHNGHLITFHDLDSSLEYYNSIMNVT